MGAEWSVLFYLGIVLLGGLFFGRLVKHIKLPNVTGYLIAGLLLGPYVTRFLSAGLLAELDLVSEVALGFIAFSIGSEFKLSYFKKVGVMPIVIAVFEGLGAVLAHADPAVKKYLGPTLIPQAGVAIGLTLVAQNVVPEFAQEIRAIVLCGTFIYEIIGPMVAKMCLRKAGEIKPENL